MMSTNPFRPGGKDDAHQGSGPRNAVANAGSSETTRQTFTDHDLPHGGGGHQSMKSIQCDGGMGAQEEHKGSDWATSGG